MLIPLIYFKIIVVKGNHLVRNYTNVKISLFSAKITLNDNDDLGSYFRLPLPNLFARRFHIKIDICHAKGFPLKSGCMRFNGKSKV
jgi:hypothetical protein